MSGRLAGKVALITGTAGGQGRAAAVAFAREGAHVVGCDTNKAGAAETVAMVQADGGSMRSAHPLDLSDSTQARAWVDEAAAGEGIDILYNNASSARFDSIATLSEEDWHYTMRNEVDLVFYACSAAWPHLVRRGRGVIINTGSICGVNSTPPTPGAFAHAAAKAAVIGLTRELALEGGPHGIRANSISPGLIEAPVTQPLLDEHPTFRGDHLGHVMLGRLGRPEDVAEMALFLASDESSWVTGANFMVDGGFSAY